MNQRGRRDWRTDGELLLARAVRQYYRLRRSTLPAYRVLPAQRHIFGNALPNPVPIPPIIWAYWESDVLPDVVERCIAGWRRLHPNWRIEILNEARARAYTSIWPDTLVHATVQQRSDWLRLELLRLHGGVWLDASTILTQPLDWILQEQQQARCDFVGFYIERFTRLPAYPVVENWCMATPTGSRFIAEVQKEFACGVLAGSAQTYLNKLKEEGLWIDTVQGIDSPLYLACHVAMQKVLQRKNASYRLSLWRAEDTAFFYHQQAGWNRAGLKKQLFMLRVDAMPAPLIKLRGPDRKRLDAYLQQGILVAGSLADRYLR